MSEIGHLESEALKRKAKLAALRANRLKQTEDNQSSEQETKDNLPRAVFRNYQPADEKFKENVLEETVPGNVTEHVQEELSKENENLEIKELDFNTLAPRKPDWDLKRDIAPKLEKLEKQTHRAIAELIRERLQKEDLANAVNVGANAARQLAEDDD